MKTDKVKIITIGSSSNRRVSREFEERQNQQLLELYKQFQENPFEYATVDYFKSKEPKVTTYPKESFISKAISRVKNIFRK